MKLGSPKSESERRIRIALLERNINVEQLAQIVSLKPASMRNIIAGTRCGSATRQRITNALAVDEIWPGVYVTERAITIPPQTETTFRSLEEARHAAAEFGDSIKRVGKTIRFIKPTPVTLSFSGLQDQATTALARRPT